MHRNRSAVEVVLVAVVALLTGFLTPASALPNPVVVTRGDAVHLGDPGSTPVPGGVMRISPYPNGQGYWLVTGSGQVFDYPAAGQGSHFYGSPAVPGSTTQFVDFVPHPSGNGYWLVSSNGGIYAFGAAQFFGSFPNASPVVSMAATASGNGYWFLYQDGSVSPFGGATVQGSAAGGAAGARAIRIVSESNGGYTIGFEDGRAFAYPAGTLVADTHRSARDVVDFDGHGTDGWMLTANGTVLPYGAAPDLGGGSSDEAFASIAATASSLGYWLATTGAVPPPPGTIDGVVTDATSGLPLAGMCVRSEPVTAPGPPSVATTTSTGYYRISPASDGLQKVHFDDCGRLTHTEEWYDDAPDRGSATAVQTTAGTTVSASAALTRAGAITGVVTDDVNGAPIASACVMASPIGAPTGGVLGRIALTSSTGYYSMRGVPPGATIVRFDDCNFSPRYLPEWSPDADFRALAQPIDVPSGGTAPGVDAALARAGTVSGVVTDALGATAPFVCVTAYRGGGAVSSTNTSSTGFYRLGRLRTGDVKVRFNDCNNSVPRYAYEWFGDVADDASSPAVPTTTGQETTGINAQLEPPGSFSGVVVEDSAPLGGPPAGASVCVQAYAGANVAGSVFTSGTGLYRINGLRPNTPYDVRFGCQGFTKYAPEWWNDAPARASATQVLPTTVPGTSGIDASLALGGSITGVVSGPSGPVPAVCVAAHNELGEVGNAFTTSTGFYRIAGLGTGPHDIAFRDCGFRDLASEWWQDSADRASATPVAVTATQEVTGVDALLAPAGRIRGVVRDASGAGLPGMCITTTPSAGFSTTQVITSSTGAYTVGGLRAGSYKVAFDDCTIGYNHQWWQNASDLASATPVGVAEGAITSGIDAAMELGVAAPATVDATAGIGSSDVAWTTPAPLPTRTITGYEITSQPPSSRLVVPPSSRNATMNGLASGTQYVFVVRALFADGRGAPRASAPVITGGLLAPPASVAAAPAALGATVTWTSPPGNPAVASYLVVSSPEGIAQTVAGDVHSTSFTGLDPSKTYTFSVSAIDDAGTGGAAVSNPVVPYGPPAAPSAVGVAPGDASATVWWTPGQNGNAATSFTVSSNGTPIATVAADQTSLTISGLTNGQAYPFSVSASNAIGTSGATAGLSVTPSSPTVAESVQMGTGESAPVTPQDGVLLLEGAGFAPNSDVILTLNSVSIFLGTVRTDAQGSFSVVVTVPPNAPTGAHTLTASGTVTGGGLRLLSSPVAITSAAVDHGYRLFGGDGSVYAFGAASSLPTVAIPKASRPVVAAGSTPSGAGSWLAGSDGAIFALGDAPALVLAGARPKQPFAAIAGNAAGDGLWLVTSSGAVSTAGAAANAGGNSATKSTVGIARAGSTGGYWLAASDGSVTARGGAAPLVARGRPKNITAITSTPSGNGFWLVSAGGEVYPAGDATVFGSKTGTTTGRVVAIGATSTGRGYRLVDDAGRVSAFGDAARFGDLTGRALPKPIVSLTS